MNHATKSNSIGWIGWIGSIAFHAILLCIIGFYAYFVAFNIKGDVRVEGTREPLPQDLKAMYSTADDGSLLAGTDRRLAERLSTHDGMRQALDKGIQAGEKMSATQQMQTIEAHSTRLESIRSQNLTNLLSYIEASAGIGPAKNPQPQSKTDADTEQAGGAPPPQARQFDEDTAELTDLIKVKTSQGKIVYLWTMTDASGLKQSFEVAEADMDATQLQVAQLFERAQKYSNFNQVFRTALKLASKRQREESAQAKRQD